MQTRLYKLPANLQRFKRGDKIVLINPDVPSWIVTNNLGEIIVKLFDGTNSLDDIVDIVSSELGDSIKDKLNKFLDGVIKSRLFETPKKETRSLYKLHIVHLSLSDKCNLKCKYCYAEERKECGQNLLSLEEYKKIIDDVLRINPHCSFAITGGEPLLNKNWFAIAKYIKSHGCECWLLSNGTFFNENNIQDIKKVFNKVQVSIDGSSAKIHTLTRGKSYSKVENAINLMKKYGIDYRLAMVVCKTNINDIETMAKKYGNRLIFQPLFSVSEVASSDDFSISGLEYYKALKSAKGVSPLSSYKTMLKNSQISKCYKCAMGDGEISISATGDVYPCQLLHDAKFLAGNTHEQSIIEIYEKSKNLKHCQNLTVNENKGCKTCAFKYICGGSCRARSFYETGDIAKSGDFCAYEKNALLDGIINLCNENLIEV